jgi:hypothetical protein
VFVTRGIKHVYHFWISYFHIGDYETYYSLACGALCYGKSMLTFEVTYCLHLCQRRLQSQPPSSPTCTSYWSIVLLSFCLLPFLHFINTAFLGLHSLCPCLLQLVTSGLHLVLTQIRFPGAAHLACHLSFVLSFLSIFSTSEID